MESLQALVAASPRATVDGQWQRHAAARYASEVLNGRKGDGRWGTEHGFPVLYLGQPLDSVVVEAYRHLVDPVDDPALARTLRPRVLVTCSVAVTEILDLRLSSTRLQVGLSLDVLQSPTDDRDAYSQCQHIAQVAHQLGFHGIIAPAATRIGATLALFTDRLPPPEVPVRVCADQWWTELPADPRIPTVSSLRLVRDGDQS
ncbi:RES family NAD+ phosphorylase [Lentzea sp. HUAS12]|uniref:RES family NAD+ phosphorylase n=1 Tax=Lentzea sp. HUAS12 TaxID=2951806 RepID=UPI00209E5593|nr:RES family NAD+ phosphorylase [Lentzea sp. HUAS12]USX56460.1 RES family NAD+ phosphorylase [Lentzea sp. HUAS12]